MKSQVVRLWVVWWLDENGVEQWQVVSSDRAAARKKRSFDNTAIDKFDSWELTDQCDQRFWKFKP